MALPDSTNSSLDLSKQDLFYNSLPFRIPIMTVVTGPLIPRCGYCMSQEGLLRCSSCKVMQYCCRDHQVADRPDHRLACKRIQRSYNHLQVEEQKLRDHPGDMFTPVNAFETSVGRFWGLPGTRDYMRARFAVAKKLLTIQSFAAVNLALDHLRQMLRLCPGDNMGVRYLVPALALRLGREQECYDLVRWHFFEGDNADYDWENGEAPFLDLADADVFEPVDYLCGKYLPSLSFNVAVTLLKIKLLLDLKDLQNATELSRKLPGEVVDNTKRFLPRTTIISDNRKLMMCTDHTALIEKLSSQVEKLYANVQKCSPHMWRYLVKPGRLLDTWPEVYSAGSKGEAILTLHYSLASWEETPGALEIIKAKIGDSKING